MTSKTDNWSQIATSIVIALIMLWGFFSSVNSSSPHPFRTATVLFFIAAIVLIIAIGSQRSSPTWDGCSLNPQH